MIIILLTMIFSSPPNIHWEEQEKKIFITVNLLKQIDGDENPFANFGNERFDNLDSVLQTRHNIIHQDRFIGTETTVKESVEFLKDLVIYIDGYLSSKMHSINIGT